MKFYYDIQIEKDRDVPSGRGRDGMVVGFTTAYAISAYHHQCCEFEYEKYEVGIKISM
jgi:hypothetical protein